MTGAIGWQAGPAAWLALLGAAIAGGAAVIAYRRVARVRFAKWMLLARLIALALLAIAAFAPSLDITAPVNQKPHLLFVIDDSLSMAETDARSEGQSLRVAESLGFIGRAAWAGDALLDQSRELTAAMSDLEAARAQRDQTRLAALPAGAEQRKVDETLSALRGQVSQLLAAANGVEALQFALGPLKKIEAALAEPNAPLPAKLVEDLISEAEHRQRQADAQRARQQPDATAAAKRAAAMPRYDLAVAAGQHVADATSTGATAVWAALDGVPAAASPPKPQRPASPIAAALASAVERVGAANCEGVILLSDGRSTEARSGLSPALLGAAVPIYPVEIASRQDVPDVRIARLSAPASAMVGEAIPVRVTVQNHAAAGSAVYVTLSDGKTTLKRDITLTDSPDAVDFTWPAAALPAVRLTATVDALPNEARKENNQADANVAVVDRKLHVALISGSAGWDVQYLRNVLARSPWVELRQQILSTGESCHFTPAELAGEDVYILCDVRAGALGAQQSEAIRTAVADQGKSALLLPGDADWMRLASQDASLAALVPQRNDQRPTWRLPPSESPTIQPVPTPPAELLPWLKLDDSPGVSATRWLARPRMYRSVAAGELKPQARALLVDRSTQAPLLTEQAVGSGRAMAILIDETWRWRRDTGGDAGDRFWLDLVRDLIDPPMAIAHGDLSIGVERDGLPAGQTFVVRARVPAAAAGSAKLSLIQNGKTLTTLTPDELLPGSGRLSARITPDTAGRAELLLAAAGGEVRLPIIIGEPLADELADTSGDLPYLQRVARQTGGVVVSLEALDTLPAQIAQRHSQRIDTIHTDVWSTPYWFAAIVACLGLEWALRKLSGMI